MLLQSWKLAAEGGEDHPPVGELQPRSASTPPVKPAKLPSITIESMTESELKSFIPQMLRTVTGKEEVWYSRRSAKPSWWPVGVPWATSQSAWQSQNYWPETLRAIVRSCYRHWGKEALLYNKNSPSPKVQCARTSTQGSTETEKKGEKVGMASSYSAMLTSEDPASSHPSIGQAFQMDQSLFSPQKAEVPCSKESPPLLAATELPFYEMFICYFCEKEFLQKEDLRLHQGSCVDRPPELQRFQSAPAPLPSPCQLQGPPPISPKPPSYSEGYNRIPLTEFTRYMNLIPKQKAAHLKRQRRHSLEINCDILDVVDPQCPLSPCTPRTPKSLMSQLSRDDSGVSTRKRLSYSQSVDKAESVESFDVVSESSDSGDEQESSRGLKTNMSLLSIDTSSLLGQRIQGHFQVDMATQVVEDTEHYCRTPVKNTFLDKLRTRPPTYPVTYRPRRKNNSQNFCHQFKFNRSQRREFSQKMRTGLNKRSRGLKKRIESCKVVLHCMTRKELKRWVPARILNKILKTDSTATKSVKRSTEQCEFPDGPTLLVKNIDTLLGLKKRIRSPEQSSLNRPLSLGNFVSEEMEAEIVKQKLTLYRSLLYEASKSGKVGNKPGKFSLKQESSSNSSAPEKKGKAVHQHKARKVEDRSSTTSRRKMDEKPSRRKISASDTAVKEVDELLAGSSPGSEGHVDVYDPDRSKCLLSSPCSTASSNCSGLEDTFTTERKRRNCDDSVSILSLSSDGESSISSNCCTACQQKQNPDSLKSSHLSAERSKNIFTRMMDCEPDAAISTRSKNHSRPKLMEPLTIDVEGNFSPSQDQSNNMLLSIKYGVPSPVSVAGDAPVFSDIKFGAVSPTKFTDVEACDSPGNGDSAQPSISADSQGDSKKAESEDDLSGRRINDSGLKFLQSGTRESKSFTTRLLAESFEIRTRSKSLTPSSSPAKYKTRSNSSLPSSPAKMHARRSILSGSSHPDSATENNQYSLRSGNFVMTTNIRQNAVQKLDRAWASLGAKSPKKLKRQASSPVKAAVRPGKLRKVQSSAVSPSK